MGKGERHFFIMLHVKEGFLYFRCRLADEQLTIEGLLGKVFDIHVCVCGQLFQHWFDFCLKGAGIK